MGSHESLNPQRKHISLPTQLIVLNLELVHFSLGFSQLDCACFQLSVSHPTLILGSPQFLEGDIRLPRDGVLHLHSLLVEHLLQLAVVGLQLVDALTKL